MDAKRIVRSYRQGDEVAISRLFNLCFGESGIYFPYSPESWVWRYVLRPGFDPESVLVIEDSGRIVSSVVMTYVRMFANGSPKQVAFIGDVTTHREYRHQGYATMLMEHAIELAKERGCWAVHLTADPSGSAIRIYSGLGFKTLIKPTILVSPLHRKMGTRLAGLVPSVPLLAIDSILSLRGIKRLSSGTKLRAIEDEQTRVSLLVNHHAAGQRNGCLAIGEDYAKWLSGSRPKGGIGVLEVVSSGETVGIATVSSIDAVLWGKTIGLASIPNPLIPEGRRDSVSLAEVLMKIREFAANRLGSLAASIIVDPRDTTTLRACRLSRFFRTVSLASMIHPLGDHTKMERLRKGYWAQPLEAAKPFP